MIPEPWDTGALMQLLTDPAHLPHMHTDSPRLSPVRLPTGLLTYLGCPQVLTFLRS